MQDNTQDPFPTCECGADIGRNDPHEPECTLSNEMRAAGLFGGTLYDYRSGEPLGDASKEEIEASLAAAKLDGGRGVIRVDGRACYVVGEDE